MTQSGLKLTRKLIYVNKTHGASCRAKQGVEGINGKGVVRKEP